MSFLDISSVSNTVTWQCICRGVGTDVADFVWDHVGPFQSGTPFQTFMLEPLWQVLGLMWKTQWGRQQQLELCYFIIIIVPVINDDDVVVVVVVVVTCNVIKYSGYLLFVDDINIFRAVNSANDCTLLQACIEHIRAWCAADCMKLNVSKTGVITFSRKTSGLLLCL
jgi:hypothetical protein